MGCGCNSNFVGDKSLQMVEVDIKEKNKKTKIKKIALYSVVGVLSLFAFVGIKSMIKK